MNIEVLRKLLPDGIRLIALREHSKATEKYVDIELDNSENTAWSGSIPYYYRRTGLFIENEKDLADYLKQIVKYFTTTSIEMFIKTEKRRWELEYSGKKTTKPFFDKLLNMRWNSVKSDLPSNPNWARRVQDIKDFGYTLATNTNMDIEGVGNTKGTHIMLLPIPKGGGSGYETMSPAFKKRAIKALGTLNAFEFRRGNRGGLIPDHKFPEIRWDDKTREENDKLSDIEIANKFQLLDNQRNLQKREICRKCFQTNNRGVIFGIEYYYFGESCWPTGIPKTGKEAEKGCIGCPWYDIQKWRESLNYLLAKEF